MMSGLVNINASFSLPEWFFASCKNDFLCTLGLLTEVKQPQNMDAEWRSDDFTKTKLM